MENEKQLDLIDRGALRSAKIDLDIEEGKVLTNEDIVTMARALVKCVREAPTVEAIVLPCKIGAAVYRIYDDCDFPGDCGTKMMCKGCDYRNLFIEKQAFCLSMLSQNGKLEHPYYLTRKEADSALAKMDGDGNV